jgi:hypothetical protein
MEASETKKEPEAVRIVQKVQKPAVEGIAAPVPVEVKTLGGNGSKTDGHCQAITKSGLPCKNLALPGMTTCRIHQSQAVKA